MTGAVLIPASTMATGRTSGAILPSMTPPVSTTMRIRVAMAVRIPPQAFSTDCLSDCPSLIRWIDSVPDRIADSWRSTIPRLRSSRCPCTKSRAVTRRSERLFLSLIPCLVWTPISSNGQATSSTHTSAITRPIGPTSQQRTPIIRAGLMTAQMAVLAVCA